VVARGLKFGTGTGGAVEANDSEIGSEAGSAAASGTVVPTGAGLAATSGAGGGLSTTMEGPIERETNAPTNVASNNEPIQAAPMNASDFGVSCIPGLSSPLSGAVTADAGAAGSGILNDVWQVGQRIVFPANLFGTLTPWPLGHFAWIDMTGTSVGTFKKMMCRNRVGSGPYCGNRSVWGYRLVERDRYRLLGQLSIGFSL